MTLHRTLSPSFSDGRYTYDDDLSGRGISPVRRQFCGWSPYGQGQALCQVLAEYALFADERMLCAYGANKWPVQGFLEGNTTATVGVAYPGGEERHIQWYEQSRIAWAREAGVYIPPQHNPTAPQQDA